MAAGKQQRALVVAHDPSGGAAVLGEAFVARGWQLDEHIVNPRFDRPDLINPLPSLDGYDLLIVLGSTHSVYDRATIGGWIDAELEMIRSAHRGGLPVFGVCFGAQALALALGGAVEASPITEIGWYHIAGDELPIGEGPWFQWHHDRLIAPPGARVLASTPGTVQLFRVGRSVGTQFHPEISPDHLACWLDLAPAEYLDRWGVDSEAIMAETRRLERNSHAACNVLVDWFLASSFDEVPTSS